MPQMSPFNWTLMYTLFLISFLMIMMKIFSKSPSSSFKPNKDSILTNLLNNNKIWKW
uniref:ATP synthase F0 subunit 8 n=1 Tax=Friesea antarctica TaxID=2720488 RepID=B2BSE1_9HEXA|nr:ATP synthase F0 subunit 8 [Friesea antarctica]ABS57594.1 ATP synthase F0 subunit 8 [Friesea antarctica]